MVSGGLNLDLSEQQRMIRARTRNFAVRTLKPAAAESDATGQFAYSLIPELAEIGVFGLPLPEKYGGLGADTLTFVLALEEMAYGDSSVAATVADQVGLCSLPILSFGNEDQRTRWLPRLIKGEVLGCLALTEPGAGSDARAISTRAELTDDCWKITGSKSFITNAGTDLTAFILVVAVTGNAHDSRPEVSMILVPRDSDGLSVGPPLRKMGWRASDTRQIFFDDCTTSNENLIGERGHGLKQVYATLDFGRIQIACLGVGVAQAAFDETVSYAESRVQFGAPIASFQATQFKIADMAVDIEAARLLTWKAAWLRDQGREFAHAASIAKLFASEAAMRSANHAVQIHGGYGFIEESTANRLFRDAKILEIGEGTSEIQRMLIARPHLPSANPKRP
jgi:butyryl-CoA dehydrogenase